MSSKNQPLARRQVEAGIVPVHVSAGFSQPVFLLPLGLLRRPIEHVDLCDIGDFINRYFVSIQSGDEGVGDPGRCALGHEFPPEMVVSNLLNQFENWVKDAGLSADELEAATDIAVCYTAFMRRAGGGHKEAA